MFLLKVTYELWEQNRGGILTNSPDMFDGPDRNLCVLMGWEDGRGINVYLWKKCRISGWIYFSANK